MSDCQVFVDEGITNPKSKYHSMDKRIKITISKKEKKLQYSVWNSTVAKIVTKTYQSNNFSSTRKLLI